MTKGTWARAVLAGLAAALLLTGCAAFDTHATRDKAIAAGLLSRGIAQSDRDYIMAHVAEAYRQHNPNAQDGRAGLLAFLDYREKQNLPVTVKTARILADGDLVALHSVYAVGAEKRVAFDIFRFRDGVAVEHWDGLQPWVEHTVSGRSMIDGPTAITDRAHTEANRDLVIGLVTDVLIHGDASHIGDYIGPEYHQHNPQVGDGLDGLAAFLEGMKKAGVTFSYDKIHHVVAEGNFVLTLSEGRINGETHAFYDLYRVENGRVVEHWDVIQKVPAQMPHDNGMF